ncbi:hypothetical protein AVEN_36939-1 [Araneus ventricosus]|uniref:Uncharacterized protein n=1 Tax=Araneus ventricosus TaxID=182803 RepID=A0A4Y2G8F7_ARAVE|nr:hypothetical protein AVEN_36939-1 [Araneus ventricosus]
MFIRQYSGKRKAQVTGTIALVQINNANRQQITRNDSNSTFNNAQLTSFPARNADETPSDFSKAFALLSCSHSMNTFPVYPYCRVFIVCLTGHDVTWKSLDRSGSWLR